MKIENGLGPRTTRRLILVLPWVLPWWFGEDVQAGERPPSAEIRSIEIEWHVSREEYRSDRDVLPRGRNIAVAPDLKAGGDSRSAASFILLTGNMSVRALAQSLVKATHRTGRSDGLLVEMRAGKLAIASYSGGPPGTITVRNAGTLTQLTQGRDGDRVFREKIAAALSKLVAR